MFWKQEKKLYRIKYEGCLSGVSTYIVWARNEGQALRKFHKEAPGGVYQIFSIEEYESEKTLWI